MSEENKVDTRETRDPFSEKGEKKDTYHFGCQKAIDTALRHKNKNERETSVREIIGDFQHVIVADFDQTFVPKDVALRLVWDSTGIEDFRWLHFLQYTKKGVEFVKKGISTVNELRWRGWKLGASGDVKLLMHAVFGGKREEEAFSLLDKTAQHLSLNTQMIEFCDAYRNYTNTPEVNMFILTRDLSYLAGKTVEKHSEFLVGHGIRVRGVIGNKLEFRRGGEFERLEEVQVTTESKSKMIPIGDICLIDTQEEEQLQDHNILNIRSTNHDYFQIVRTLVDKRRDMKFDHLLEQEEKLLSVEEEELLQTENHLESLFRGSSITSEVGIREKTRLYEEFLIKRRKTSTRKATLSGLRKKLHESLEQLTISMKGTYHTLSEDIVHTFLRYIRRRLK
ncbi:MAG TPA: hypothetical protein VJ179_01990 [Patescibacteria group bacterium]|nr:hypothetical protein [Patescibacteria group bacterium]